jgi:hypothetical protein
MPTQAPLINLAAEDGCVRACGPGLGLEDDGYGACLLHFRTWAHSGCEICI